MTRNAGLGGSARRAAELALLFGLAASPALAGDRALFGALGYSDDFRYFAFEEYGVQDGSGFPYATVYVVDLPADRWVTGSPYRIRLETEDETVAAARAAAISAYAPTAEKLGISASANLIALNGDGEAGDGQTLSFGLPTYITADFEATYSLSLTQFETASSADCENILGTAAKGFALTIEGDGPPRDAHRDGAGLPGSRGCVTGYRIYGVVAPADAQDLTGVVALVSVYPFGFEGPDRRFLAVPLAP